MSFIRAVISGNIFGMLYSLNVFSIIFSFDSCFSLKVFVSLGSQGSISRELVEYQMSRVHFIHEILSSGQDKQLHCLVELAVFAGYISGKFY